MSIDKQSIKNKLYKLEGAIKLLERYKKLSKEDFLIDFTINSAAMYNLILGIEIIIDIGGHILNEVYQVSPQEYKEVIKMLGEYEIVPEAFSKKT